MREGVARIQLAAVEVNGRPIDIVQKSFGQIGGGRQIFQPLLILNADGVASELVREPDCGDIHPALVQDLGFRELCGRIVSNIESQPFLHQPIADSLRLAGRNSLHGGVEHRLAEAFLEDTRRMQEFVGDDGVVHTHTALVEHSHDRLVRTQMLSKFAPGLFCALRQLEVAAPAHVMILMTKQPTLQPAPKTVVEEVIFEVGAPESAVLHARLGKGPIQVEHTDESGPLAAPVGDREDRPLWVSSPAERDDCTARRPRRR